MTDYWFFLSYARRNDVSHTLATDDDKTRKLVRRFHEELAAEIISRANTGQARTAEQVGFFDQVGIEPGDTWDVTLAEALRTARVMVCLFTRNYFNSRVSGQEFEVFQGRVRQHAAGGALPPLIIPVLWHRPDKLPSTLPAAAADLQYTYDEFSKVYTQEGLEYIMRLTKHSDDYQEFLIKFADRLIEVAEKHVLKPLPQVPPLTTVKSAFHVTPVAAAAPQAGPGTLANSGPNFVHFVFVAGQSHELQAIRNKLTAYAQEGRLWKPYLPDVDRAGGAVYAAGSDRRRSAARGPAGHPGADRSARGSRQYEHDRDPGRRPVDAERQAVSGPDAPLRPGQPGQLRHPGHPQRKGRGAGHRRPGPGPEGQADLPE